MNRLELRNLRPELIARYLVDELGGEEVEPARVVRGPGWTVHLVEGEPAPVGRFRVPVLFVDIEGADEETVTGFLRRKTMRGGG